MLKQKAKELGFAVAKRAADSSPKKSRRPYTFVICFFWAVVTEKHTISVISSTDTRQYKERSI